MSYKNDPVKLPEISFVAGDTQEWSFHVMLSSGEAFNLNGAAAQFAVQRPESRSAQPFWSKTMDVTVVDGERMLTLTLDSADSVEWEGMYIYQISILDSGGNFKIPGHGKLIVTRNIDADFLNGGA